MKEYSHYLSRHKCQATREQRSESARHARHVRARDADWSLLLALGRSAAIGARDELGVARVG